MTISKTNSCPEVTILSTTIWAPSRYNPFVRIARSLKGYPFAEICVLESLLAGGKSDRE